MHKNIIEEDLQQLVADIGANPHSEEMVKTIDELSEKIVILFGATTLNKILNRCYDEIEKLGGNLKFLEEFNPVEVIQEE